MECQHKTPNDHILSIDNDCRTWVCSSCHNSSVWTKDHSSYGQIECPICEVARMDWVACSDVCAEKLKKMNKGER